MKVNKLGQIDTQVVSEVFKVTGRTGCGWPSARTVLHDAGRQWRALILDSLTVPPNASGKLFLAAGSLLRVLPRLDQRFSFLGC